MASLCGGSYIALAAWCTQTATAQGVSARTRSEFQNEIANAQVGRKISETKKDEVVGKGKVAPVLN
jgi:hypothetical protein